MRRPRGALYLLCTLVLSVFLAVGADAAAGANLLENGSLENVNPSSGQPVRWYKFAHNGQFTVELAVGHNGTNSLRIVGHAPDNANARAGVSQPLRAPIILGSRYGLRFKYKGEIVRADAHLRMGSQRYTFELPPHVPDWVDYLFVVETPPELVGTEAEVEVFLYGRELGEAWYDDIELIDMSDASAVTSTITSAAQVIDVMPNPEPPSYATLKEQYLETHVVRDAQPQAYIVVPAAGIYDAQARGIQAEIARRTGIEVPIVADNDPRAAVRVPRHWAGPDALRPLQDDQGETPPLASNLIVLGNRSTNKTIGVLYDLFFTLLDLKYPGDGGYEVRSLHSPFGDGRNVIFVGGSDADGVAQAAAALSRTIAQTAKPGQLSLGWLMEIRLGRDVKVPADFEQVEIWEASELYKSRGYFGWNSISKRMALYYMTGDPTHAREVIRLSFPDAETKKWIEAFDGERIENKDDPLAGPYHYNAHMMILLWDLIEESPVFTDEERLQVTNAFSRQLIHRRGENIYGKTVPPIVGDRHVQWSALSLYVLGRYFQKEYGDRVWDYAVYGALNHFGSLHKYASVGGDNDNLFWYNTMYAPILTYLVLTGDRRPIENGVLDELLRIQEILISGRVPDWALQYAALDYLHKAAYLTGDGRWLRYRERTGVNTDVFRLGQSFWPDESLKPSDPVDLVGKWSIHYLLPHEWAKRQDGLALEESFSLGSYRSEVDHTGDFILIDGFNGAARNPYHTFAVLELRLKGIPLLKGYRNQVLTRADGMVEPHIAMNAALKHADVVGKTAAVAAEVPNAAYTNWRRTLIQRTGQYALFVDDLTFREDANNMEVQITWELDSPGGGLMRPMRTSLPLRTSMAGQIVTMEWSEPVKSGQKQRFFTLMGALRGECHALTENAAALALPAAAVALVGQYRHTEAQVAVLGSDHAFGLGLTRLGLDQPLLTADHPVDLDWDYAAASLEVVTAQATLLHVALDAAQVTVNGEQANLESAADGTMLLSLPAGRHKIAQAAPKAALLASTKAGLQEALILGEKQPMAKRQARAAASEISPPALQQVASLSVKGRIADMITIPLAAGQIAAVAAGKTIHLLSADGETIGRMETDGQIRILRWWPEHQLLLAGCVDEKVIAFNLVGERQWVFVSEMDPALYAYAKPYVFKTAPGLNGVHGLYTGVFLNGQSQAFVGGASTVEIIDEHGRLIKRLPAIEGLCSVFNIVKTSAGSLNLLAGRKSTGFNDVAIINDQTLSADQRGFRNVPAGASFVDGWAAMNRHHLFYEDLAGQGTKIVVGDINGTYNRVTAWDADGKALYDASFGPGMDYSGSGWREDFFDNRNVRDMDIADLDGNGTKEVVVALWTGYVLGLDHQLQKVWAAKLASAPTALRIVRSGAATYIVVGSEDGTLSLFDSHGQLVRRGSVPGVPTFIEALRNDAGVDVVMVGTHIGQIRGFVIGE